MCGGSCTLSIDATMLMQVGLQSSNLLALSHIMSLSEPEGGQAACNTSYIPIAQEQKLVCCDFKPAAALVVPIRAACVCSSASSIC